MLTYVILPVDNSTGGTGGGGNTIPVEVKLLLLSGKNFTKRRLGIEEVGSALRRVLD
jgi:hypothetical protein